MNIHPLFVHFPIALLSVYAILECLRISRLTRERWFLYMKAGFLFFGMAGAGAAIATGDFGERLFPDGRQIIEMHKAFAGLTFVIFGIIAVAYLVELVVPYYGTKWPILIRVKKLFPASAIVTLALLGLASLFVTGALGATIVYGPGTDPIVLLINRLLGLPQ